MPEVTMRHLTVVGAVVVLQTWISGCTGLVAGPEVKSATPVPASRDSAYVRTRRALSAESFTLDVVDSSGGHITGIRYPSGEAKLGTPAKCRVALVLDVSGEAEQAEVRSTSRWIAPDTMQDKAGDVLVPPPTP